MATERTYFYVFLPDTVTPLDEKVRKAFQDLQRLYGHEAKVTCYTPKDRGFRKGLSEFGVKRIPGFAIADQEYDLAKLSAPPNPYISFDRPFLEEKEQDDIFTSIQDLHNICMTEDLLHLRRTLIMDGARRFFGKVWDEVKDIIQIGIPR